MSLIKSGAHLSLPMFTAATAVLGVMLLLLLASAPMVRADQTPYGTILINGNGQFTSANGVVSGSGTQSDPYIIENWAINASSTDGIYIQNTTAYFIVRNCLVENGRSGYHYGIVLDNLTNGKIESNTCENNYGGIYLWDSSNNNTISGNVCSYNYFEGIFVGGFNNTLDNNTCENNGTGIYLSGSTYGNLTGNTCENNGVGIELLGSSNNTLTGNTLEHDGTDIDLQSTVPGTLPPGENSCVTYSSSNNTFTLNRLLDSNVYDTCTNYWDNNGKGNYWSDWQPPTYLHTNGIINTSRSIAGGSNQDHYPLVISYVSSSPISINGNIGFIPQEGVTGGSGTQNDPYIIENWAINASTANGIDIENTTAYFVVCNCLVENGYNDNYDGIYLDNVVNGLVENNTCENDSNGIYLVLSSNDNVIGNAFAQDNLYNADIWLLSSSNIIVHGNITNDSIILTDSSYDDIGSNICDNAGVGISLENYSDYNTLTNNTCRNNFQNGIYLLSSSNNTLSNNTCGNNNSYGIYLYSSSNDNLTSNTCSNNFDRGIYLDNSSYNNLTNNTCSNNSDSGIELSSSSNNTLSGNTCSNNSDYSVYLSSSNSNTISHNYLLNNGNNAYDDNTNSWDNGSAGNYWSDWQPGMVVNGVILTSSNGVAVNQPRPIAGGTNQDNYPLVLATTAPPSGVWTWVAVGILVIVVIAVVAWALMRRK